MCIKILPSMLSADYGHLADDARRAEAAGADELHLDIMDGHFVPNLSFGSGLVSMAKKNVKIPLDTHLMLTHPDKYVDDFAKCGSDAISIHVEADCDIHATLKQIRNHGIRAGLTLKPKTPASELVPFLGEFDYVLCMTVEPGYGGQSFMEEVLPKIEEVRALAIEQKAKGEVAFPIMVDGGINDKTIELCAKAGASQFVAGNYLFKAEDMQSTISLVKKIASANFANYFIKKED